MTNYDNYDDYDFMMNLDKKTPTPFLDVFIYTKNN